MKQLWVGTCKRSNKNDDTKRHIDFYWNSPKKGILAIDAKGLRKRSRKDKEYDDTIQWIEMKNVHGNDGWVYGDSDYVAFRTKKDIIFVQTKKIKEYGENICDGKEILYGRKNKPSDCYKPYCRDKNKEVIFMCPTSDMVDLSSFIIDL